MNADGERRLPKRFLRTLHETSSGLIHYPETVQGLEPMHGHLAKKI